MTSKINEAAENAAREAQAQVKQLTAELAKTRGVAEQLAGQQQNLQRQHEPLTAAQRAQIGRALRGGRSFRH